jgi:hypothetical protein
LIDSSIDVTQSNLSDNSRKKLQMNMAFCKSIMSISIVGLVMVSAILDVNAEVLSPRQQMASGIDAEDVECKSGFALMIRSTNGAAACVKSSTSIKLSNTGWGNIIKTTMEEPKQNDENLKVEPIKNSESTEEPPKENVIEIKIKDGVGTGDR